MKAIESCIDDISIWMLTGSLKSNDGKIVVGVGECNISPGSTAINLGSWFDSKLAMITHSCLVPLFNLYNI